MGNQGHSLDDGRTAVEYLQAGAIGAVTEVHVWTNRPLGFWPQGVPRPAPLTTPADGLRWNGPGITARLGAAMTGHYPMPEGLAWDLFLGPAPFVEYHPVYHPFNWRGWVDWGAGPLGDMGAHLIDHAYWALDLGFPTTIETVSTPFNGVAFPHATTTYYEFAARGRAAGGEDDLVRRRAAAAQAGGDGRGDAQPRRRHAGHRQQGQAAVRDLRLPSRACCPSRCTNRWGRRLAPWRESPTNCTR